jgi:hypothetical protein
VAEEKIQEEMVMLEDLEEVVLVGEDLEQQVIHLLLVQRKELLEEMEHLHQDRVLVAVEVER